METKMKLLGFDKQQQSYNRLFLEDYQFNPLVSANLTRAQRDDLIEQAENAFYEYNRTNWYEWVLTYVPMHVIQRSCQSIQILAQVGRVCLLGVVPYGTAEPRFRHSADPILPVICDNNILASREYCTSTEGLVYEMQRWVTLHLDISERTTAFQEQQYMESARMYASSIMHGVEQAVLLSKIEQDAFKAWLYLFAGNPKASLNYALRILK